MSADDRHLRSLGDSATLADYQAEVRELRDELQRLRNGDADEPRRPLRQADVLRTFLDVMRLRAEGGEHSSVSIGRNARGVVQLDVSVRDADPDAASAKAVQLFDALRAIYPLPAGEAGD